MVSSVVQGVRMTVRHSARSHTFWKSCVLGLRDGEQRHVSTLGTTSQTTTAQTEASN